MVCRLERRKRQAPQESAKDQKRRPPLPNQTERHHRVKKSPAREDTISAILEARTQNGRKSPDLRSFTRSLCKELGHLKPHQLNQLVVDAFWNRCRAAQAPATAYGRSFMLRKILVGLQDLGAPHIIITRMKKPQARATIATSEKVDALLTDAKPHFRLFILLCWHLALRFSEALSVTPNSFNPQDRTITVRTKGGKVRTIGVTQDVHEMLTAAKQTDADPNTSCIAILNGGKGISPDAIRRIWTRHAERAGVPELRPHDLRRTTATNLYRATHDLRAVQQYLGHDSLTSTVSYLAPLAKEEMSGLHRLLNFHSDVKQ